MAAVSSLSDPLSNLRILSDAPSDPLDSPDPSNFSHPHHHSQWDCSFLRLDWSFLVLTTLMTLIALLSLLGNAFVCILLPKTHSLPSNVKLLLLNTSFVAALLSLSTVVRGLLHFYMYFVDFLVLDRFVCTVLESPTHALIFSFTLSVSGIGVDRVLSIMRRRRNRVGSDAGLRSSDDRDRNPESDRPTRSAYYMLGSVYVVALLVNATMLISDYRRRMDHRNPNRSATICYCAGMLAESDVFPLFVCPTFVGLEILTIMCYLAVYEYSRSAYLDFSINTSRHSLSDRYQMMSNIRTTVLLTPTIIVHAITYVFLGVLVTCLRLTLSKTDRGESERVINYVLLALIVIELEGISHPIWLLARHRPILKTAARRVKILTRFLKHGEKSEEEGVGEEEEEGKVRGRGSRRIVLEKPKVAVLSDQITVGVIDFRLQPDQNNRLLTSIWATSMKSMGGRRTRRVEAGVARF